MSFVVSGIPPGRSTKGTRHGWHTLSVSGEGANPGEDDLARLAEEVNLDRRDAEGILSAVKDAVAGLRGLTPVGH